MKMRKFLRIIQQKLLEVKMNNIFPNENEKIFKNYTHGELKAAFDKYKNKSNWKSATEAVVDTVKEAELVKAAFEFYLMGSDAIRIETVMAYPHPDALVKLPFDVYVVKSKGYYYYENEAESKFQADPILKGILKDARHWKAMSAAGDWHKNIPKGYAGVYYGIGGRTAKGNWPEGSKWILMPEIEYHALQKTRGSDAPLGDYEINKYPEIQDPDKTINIDKSKLIKSKTGKIYSRKKHERRVS